MKRQKNRYRKYFIAILVLVAVLLMGYSAVIFVNRNHIPGISDNERADSSSLPSGGSKDTLPAGETKEEEAASSSEINRTEDDLIKEQISRMSVEEKVGQLVICGVNGYENDADSKLLIEKYHIGGFILFKKNIRDSEQMLELLNSLKRSNLVNETPLFLSIDEEGGRVSRFPDEFLKFPTNQKLGKLNDSSLSYKVGSTIGEELKAFGFNMDFAPVLDINSNPKNPVIGDRSFGNNANIVTKLGIQTMKGLQDQNIISAVKHFPGHGDTSVDSHKGLPIVNNDLYRLESFELKPFAAAIENNADMVMVAHILLPKIDNKNPASFSKTIISDILRTDMGYDGVVITDDFTMGAIVKNYDIGNAAVKSVQAGSDIVLVCHDLVKEEAVIMALQNAVKKGSISLERLDQSVYRILKLKQKYSVTSDPVQSVNTKIINDKIKAVLAGIVY
jgi:beta-N-acetylhexosaminidase